MPQHNAELETAFHDLFDTYYREALGDLAAGFPKDTRTLHVEYDDLYRFDPDLADDWREQPTTVRDHAEAALASYDLPVDVDLSGADVRLSDDARGMDTLGVEDLGEDTLGKTVAIEAQVGDVTVSEPRLEVGEFECQRCGTLNSERQSFEEASQPHECVGCERSGPFALDAAKSEWVDQRRLKLEAPPEDTSSAEAVAYALGDLSDPEDGTLADRAGKRVRVVAEVKASMTSMFGGRGENEPTTEPYLVVQSFDWEGVQESTIDVDEYRDRVETLASRDDAVDLFARNIHPSLVVTDPWETAIEMSTAWLFSAPRIDPVGGDTVRGDIHMLFVSDPGMNKSNFASKLAELSPQCLVKDSEGMSSEVALTAAATREGFGDGQWTIKPGAAPKANGGHLILDEIDKGPSGFLNGMHSLLEGNQQLNVEKAGQEATLATRFGFLALGNPTEGTFDPYESSIADQVDLHDALMSRFDLICTMQDVPDEEHDESVASGVLDSVDESARLDHGDLAREDAQATQGDVDRDVLRAWVEIAREEVQPMLTEDAKARLSEFYVETRGLNDDAEGEQAPVTARSLMAGWRIAAAFARVELSDTIEARHAERATELSKAVVGLNYDPDTGEWDANRTTETPSTQEGRKNAITACCRDADDPVSLDVIAERTGIARETVEKEVDALMTKGALYSPENGKYLAT